MRTFLCQEVSILRTCYLFWANKNNLDCRQFFILCLESQYGQALWLSNHFNGLDARWTNESCLYIYIHQVLIHSMSLIADKDMTSFTLTSLCNVNTMNCIEMLILLMNFVTDVLFHSQLLKLKQYWLNIVSSGLVNISTYYNDLE